MTSSLSQMGTAGSGCGPPPAWNDGLQNAGLALLEVVVAMGILALGIAVIFATLAKANALNFASAQRIAAILACRDALEQARSEGHFALGSGSVSNSGEIVLYGRPGGTATVLKAVRTVTLSQSDDPMRTDVEVAVAWTYRGHEYREVVVGSIYAEESVTTPSAAIGSLTGVINLNPNNSPDSEFELETESGLVITRDDLSESFAGFSGAARRIRVKPKGSGRQNGLLYNGEQYTMENNCCYEIASENMVVNLFNDKVTKKGKAMGQWWLDIRADQAVIRIIK